jgi:hypothetical protein
MPGGDGTGPAGMGPMTGRAAGYCAGYAAPGYANSWPRRGFGFGRGGRGRRNWYYATGLTGWQRAGYGYPMMGPEYAPAPSPYGLSKEDEIKALQNQAKYMQENLEDINKRIQELEEEKSK